MRGLLYSSDSSARREVDVAVLPTGNLQVRDGRDVQSWLLADLTIEPRLAGVPAVVMLPEGGRLEVADADAFYAALGGGRMRWLHALEEHWALALVCAAVSVGVVFWFVTYGIPLAARVAAELMPDEVHDLVGREGLAAMDRYLFEPTELAIGRQAELQLLFADVVSVLGNEDEYELRFRDSDAFGPNAFALPSGIVVLTDELVALADDDDELAAVLAHEVGHVVHRHAMRQLIQNSVAAGLIVAVTGDLGSATNLAAGIPTVLLNASYSRDFEREADESAFLYLETRGIDTAELGELLVRIDEDAGRNPGRATLLDSHPASRERLEVARERRP
ncbi:MAG: M48 family metallopeptidase [Chromatiales bacterium]|nr:MAG: M48 family metallopeptidase [Chromatiales bacterium]